MHIGDLVKVKIKDAWKTGVFMGEARKMSYANAIRVYLYESQSEEVFGMYEVFPFEDSKPLLCKIIIDCKNPFHVRRVSIEALCDSCVLAKID